MSKGAARAIPSDRWRRRRAGAAPFLLLLLAGTLPSCKRLFVSASQPDAGYRPDPEKSPLTVAELSTDDPLVALPNMESAVNGAERTIEKAPDAQRLSQAAELHLVRAQFLGRISDYERALELGERMVREYPKEPKAYLGRARTRAAVHRFEDALSDLEEAARLKGEKALLDQAKVPILQATGHPEEALAVLRSIEPRGIDLSALGTEAALIGETGDLTKAEKLFALAQHRLHGVSPFPLAWLYYTQGLMWERAGNAERARVLFEAALVRVPTYAPAISHLAAILAATNRRKEAIALLRPLANAEDPEPAGALAGLLMLESDKAEAERLRARANDRYDALMLSHPEAYANHAARFWLGAGDDPKKALAAAKKELSNRKTGDGWELALTAAVAAHDRAESCRLAKDAADEKEIGKNILALAAVAFDACGDREGKAAIEARLAAGR